MSSCSQHGSSLGLSELSPPPAPLGHLWRQDPY